MAERNELSIKAVDDTLRSFRGVWVQINTTPEGKKGAAELLDTVMTLVGYRDQLVRGNEERIAAYADIIPHMVELIQLHINSIVEEVGRRKSQESDDRARVIVQDIVNEFNQRNSSESND